MSLTKHASHWTSFVLISVLTLLLVACTASPSAAGFVSGEATADPALIATAQADQYLRDAAATLDARNLTQQAVAFEIQLTAQANTATAQAQQTRNALNFALTADSATVQAQETLMVATQQAQATARSRYRTSPGYKHYPSPTSQSRDQHRCCCGHPRYSPSYPPSGRTRASLSRRSSRTNRDDGHHHHPRTSQYRRGCAPHPFLLESHPYSSQAIGAGAIWTAWQSPTALLPKRPYHPHRPPTYAPGQSHY